MHYPEQRTGQGTPPPGDSRACFLPTAAFSTASLAWFLMRGRAVIDPLWGDNGNTLSVALTSSREAALTTGQLVCADDKVSDRKVRPYR